MKILVTGAKGMLGQDLCPILKNAGHNVIETDYDTLDILNENRTNDAIIQINPDVVIHLAAYTNVDKAEKDYDNAYNLNVIGTRNVAMAVEKINGVMLYVSTDYVFDGKKNKPYTPQDTPEPISVYGKTKYLGEQEVQRYCPKYYIARTSWLYGKNGKNFVETMLKLYNENKDIKVVDDQIGSPTSTVDLSRGILKLLNMTYGIYHLSGKNKTTWYKFAKKIFELQNVKPKLKPCKTKDYKTDAKRPSYSYLESESFMKDWESSLKEYLEERKA